jgi:hypothetical protein
MVLFSHPAPVSLPELFIRLQYTPIDRFETSTTALDDLFENIGDSMEWIRAMTDRCGKYISNSMHNARFLNVARQEDKSAAEIPSTDCFVAIHPYITTKDMPRIRY